MHSVLAFGQQMGSRLTGRLRDFFFAEEVPYGMALARIALPLVLLADLLKHWQFARETYSADGATTSIWINYGLPNPWPELSGAWAVALFTLLLVSLVTASLGWMTRVSLALSTGLYFYFQALDSAGTASKYSVIATHALLLLTLSRCGDVWSFDALRRGGPTPRSAVWPARLLQILIGVVYFGAAITKLHTPGFFNGDQMLFWTLTHLNEAHPVGEVMSHYPALLIVGAYAAAVFEMTFLFLCWRGWTRPVVLATGLAFHVGTYFSLGLIYFPLMYFAIYWAFLSEREARIFGRVARQFATATGLAQRLSLTAAAARLAPVRRLGLLSFALTLWAVSLGGVIAEWCVDPYQQRGPGGPLALRPMDDATVQPMLARPEPLRMKDKFFALELGTDLFAETVVGRKTTFGYGETLIVQCHVPPPHEDMYIECGLETAEGRPLETNGRILLRETVRQTFRYNICNAVPPGEYAVRLRAAGQEVARRRFTVLGDATVAVDGVAADGVADRTTELPPALPAAVALPR